MKIESLLFMILIACICLGGFVVSLYLAAKRK